MKYTWLICSIIIENRVYFFCEGLINWGNYKNHNYPNFIENSGFNLTKSERKLYKWTYLCSIMAESQENNNYKGITPIF